MALDSRYKAVGFDMDGTFLHTEIDYYRLGNVVYDVLADLGVPESMMDRNSGANFDLSSCLKWLQSQGRTDDANSVFTRIAAQTLAVEMEHSDKAKLFPGALEVLSILKEKGYKVGILTRGGRDYAEYVLRLCGVLDKFDALVARDDFPDMEAKPSPMAMVNLGNALGGIKPENILYLGDSVTDWMTARDSGAGFYGVETGSLNELSWKRIDEDIAVLYSIQDLLNLI